MLKRFFKNNSHNAFFKVLAGFGRSLNRLYENRNHDVYSNGELTILRKLAALNPKVIIDAGANTGGYSRHVKEIIPKCRLYAFEPVPSTFEILSINLQGLPDTSTINKGLYSENCVKRINLFNSSTHSSLYDIQGISYTTTDSVEIKLVKGDDFLKEEGIEQIDLLKLDIEGAEFDVLKGFDQALNKGNIRMIQFEYGYINITTKNLLLDYYKLFEEREYIVGKIFPKKVEFRKYEFKYEDFLGPNFIAVKKDDMELIALLS